MSQALRKLTGSISKSKTCVIFINQLREKIGVFFGNPEVTPGGRALKFYSSVRIDVRRVERLKDKGETYGNRLKIKVVKNKVAPPYKEALVDLIFGKGVSREGDLFDIGVNADIITKAGSFYSYGEVKLGQGRDNSLQFVKMHPELFDKIEREVKGKFFPKNATNAQ